MFKFGGIKRKLLALICCSCCAGFLSYNVFAEPIDAPEKTVATVDNDEIFEIDEDVLVSYNGKDEDVVVPNNIKSIAFGAFMDNEDLKSVVLPEGLEMIDECAFYGCNNLTEIVLPDSVVHVGRLAFGECSSLTKMSIGENLSEIMELFTYDCVSLDKFEVSEKNTNFVASDGILYSKDMQSLIACPQNKSGKIQIPESVITVKEHAFLECCNIEEIVVGDGVKYIDEASFYGCYDLRKVTLGKSVKKIRSYAFAECPSLEEFVVGDSVRYIGNGAFYNCNNLSKFVCEGENTEFGEDVFSNGSELTIVGPENSDVEFYAKDNNYSFEAM